MRAPAALVFVVMVLVASGCARPSAGPTAAPKSVPASSAVSAEASAAPIETAAATLPATTSSAADSASTPPGLSERSLAYAKDIGGTSRRGEKLYFIIGDSVDSESEVQSLLDKAIPTFGDMQSYFIVQRSDNFDGMRPGWWVVVEAYRESPSPENRQFAKRGFPGAYVKQATVQTDDPIPLYEDLVPQ